MIENFCVNQACEQTILFLALTGVVSLISIIIALIYIKYKFKKGDVRI